jgi:hypothetical protein
VGLDVNVAFGFATVGYFLLAAGVPEASLVCFCVAAYRFVAALAP